VYRTPKLTIQNAYIDGEYVTGTFVFPTDIRYELKNEEEDLFQATGTVSVISDTVISLLENGEISPGAGKGQAVAGDIGAGRHVVQLDFRNVSQSEHRWGNSGEGGTPADATGEDIHAQLAVLDRYLQRALIDSTNPAILEISEYSEEGRYAPLKVKPRNPNVVFDSTTSTSVGDGTMALVEIQDFSDSGAPQEER
jgi:hypothetical protein